MRALAFVRRDSSLAISTIRTLWPMRELNKRGHYCRFVDGQEMHNVSGYPRKEQDRMLGNFDLFVFSRVLGPGTQCPLQRYWDRGTKIIFEVDDDLTDGDRLQGLSEYMDQQMAWTDAVTVSTPYLSQLMMERYGKPTYVLPNHIDVGYYAQMSMGAERQVPGLSIGLIGTGSHWFDWYEPVEALKRLKAVHPEVSIIAAGCYPEYLKQVPGLTFVRGLPFDQYPALLRQVDIRLIPLEHNAFNMSKSPIAAMEAMAAARRVGDEAIGGAIPVCSDHPVYNSFVESDRTGIIVKDNRWYEALLALVEDHYMRTQLAMAGLEWVQRCDIRQGITHWEHAYSEIIGGDHGPNLSDPTGDNIIRGRFDDPNKQRDGDRKRRRRVLGKS